MALAVFPKQQVQRLHQRRQEDGRELNDFVSLIRENKEDLEDKIQELSNQRFGSTGGGTIPTMNQAEEVTALRLDICELKSQLLNPRKCRSKRAHQVCGQHSSCPPTSDPAIREMSETHQEYGRLNG